MLNLNRIRVYMYNVLLLLVPRGESLGLSASYACITKAHILRRNKVQ